MTDVNEEQEEYSDFVEYLGEAPYGVDFLASHTLPRGDILWRRNKIDMDRDLVWERDVTIPNGQPGNRMLLPTEGIPDAALDKLLEQPQYRRVSE